MKQLIILLAGLTMCCNADELPEALTRLVEKRQAAIDAIDKRFAEELRKLQSEYMKQGNLDAANAVAKLLDNNTEIIKAPILGEWNFFYRGRKRVFRFSEDGTYTGQYPVSGNTFAGTWEGNDQKVVTKRNGVKGRHATIRLQEDGSAKYLAEGFEMTGKRP